MWRLDLLSMLHEINLDTTLYIFPGLFRIFIIVMSHLWWFLGWVFGIVVLNWVVVVWAFGIFSSFEDRKITLGMKMVLTLLVQFLDKVEGISDDNDNFECRIVTKNEINFVSVSQFGLGVSMPASRSAGLGFSSCQWRASKAQTDHRVPSDQYRK